MEQYSVFLAMVYQGNYTTAGKVYPSCGIITLIYHSQEKLVVATIQFCRKQAVLLIVTVTVVQMPLPVSHIFEAHSG